MTTLREGNPEAAKMWAQDLNGDLTPDDVGIGSEKKAFFRCLSNPDHLFHKKICKMTSDRDGHNVGCIYCGPNAKEAFPGETDLFTVCPEAAKTWDHEQNAVLGLDPLKLLKGSNKFAHFICGNGHDEFRKIQDYTKAPYCQICAHSLLINYPSTAVFLDQDENSIDSIQDFIVSDRRILHLKCPHCGYAWNWRASLWKDNLCCPHCGYDGSEGSCEKNSFVKEKYHITTFQDANPGMSAYWDYGRNGKKRPENIVAKTNDKYAFRCENRHSFMISPSRLFDIEGNPLGCPYCEGRSAWLESGVNDLLTTVPETNDFWDYEGNTLAPSMYLPDSKEEAHFHCGEGHSFTMRIRKFARDPHCPECRTIENEKKLELKKQKAILQETAKKREFTFEDSFAYNKPEAAKHWNFELNGDKTPENTPKSAIKTIYLNCCRGKHEPYPIRPADVISEPYGCPACREEDKQVAYQKYSLMVNVPVSVTMWDKERNAMALEDAKIYMSDSAMFLCDKGHSFPRTIKSFVEDQSCPECSREKVARYPHMVRQWNFKENRKRGLDVNLTSANSTEFAAWRCKKCGYEWEARIINRKNGAGTCPCCEERMVVAEGITDLFTMVPDIKQFYDFEANERAGIAPGKLSVASQESVSWKCPDCGYRWNTSVCNRIIKNDDGTYSVRGCPVCSGKVRIMSYGEEYPQLKDRFNEELNRCSLDSIISQKDARKDYFWDCNLCGETFSATVMSQIRSMKTKSQGCPYCSGKDVLRENSFAALHPELMDEYDPANTIDPYMVTEGSNRSANWICRNDSAHRWPATFYERASGWGRCPVCKDYSCDTRFYEKYPEYESWYNTERNPRPFKMLPLYCNDTLWWMCAEYGHSFPKRLYNIEKAGRLNCPYCENQLVLSGFNDLAALRPDLLTFYDYEKNDLPPEKMLINSNDWNTWWHCAEGHSFQRSVSRMCETTSCTVCDRKLVVTGINDAETAYPAIVDVWDYDKNDCLPSEISDKATSKYFYLCEHGHSYEAYLKTMVNNGFNCLICDNVMVVPGINSLNDTHPELCEEISPNEERDPSTLTKNMTYAMLWRCKDCGGDYHYPVCDREVGDDDCPFCNGRYTKLGVNSLIDTDPELAKEFSPTNDYSVERVNKKSNNKVKWICSTCSGEYWYKLNEREVGDESCPYCRGERALAGFNTLETVLDDVDEVWAESNEKAYTEVLSISKAPADWRCTVCGGIYSNIVEDFVQKHLKGEDDCPYCNGRKPLSGFNTLETVLDDIENVWAKSNERSYTELLPTYRMNANWKCEVCGGIYSDSVSGFIEKHLAGEDDCPYCNGRKPLRGFNTLETVLDDIEDIWAKSNEKAYTEVLPTHKMTADWKCRVCGGIYSEAVESFIEKHLAGEDDCPYCNGRKPLRGFNTLETVLDDIEDIWAESNEKPYTEVLPTHKMTADWKCRVCGGIYSEAVESFIEKHLAGEDDCPYCNGRRPLRGYNTLKAVSPLWFSEWSYQNNYLICDPDEILPTHNEKVWWECSTCHHDYPMSPKVRGVYEKRHKTACPYCKGLRRRKRYFF